MRFSKYRYFWTCWFQICNSFCSIMSGRLSKKSPKFNWRSSFFLGNFLPLLYLWHFLPIKNCKGDLFQECWGIWEIWKKKMMTTMTYIISCPCIGPLWILYCYSYSSPKVLLLMAHGSSVGAVQSLSLLTFSSFGLEDFYLFFFRTSWP